MCFLQATHRGRHRYLRFRHCCFSICQLLRWELAGLVLQTVHSMTFRMSGYRSIGWGLQNFKKKKTIQTMWGPLIWATNSSKAFCIERWHQLHNCQWQLSIHVSCFNELLTDELRVRRNTYIQIHISNVVQSMNRKRNYSSKFIQNFNRRNKPKLFKWKSAFFLGKPLNVSLLLLWM